MYIKLYYSADHKPIGAAELYAEIANAEHENICKDFLEDFSASTICDFLMYPDMYNTDEVCEDKFLIFQDEYIDDFINDNYKSTTIYVDDNDIVDGRDVAR